MRKCSAGLLSRASLLVKSLISLSHCVEVFVNVLRNWVYLSVQFILYLEEKGFVRFSDEVDSQS